jgi:hypothetical protein
LGQTAKCYHIRAEREAREVRLCRAERVLRRNFFGRSAGDSFSTPRCGAISGADGGLAPRTRQVNLIEKSTSFGAQSTMRTVMDTLEHYLDSDYVAQKQDIATIDRLLVDVARTFVAIFDKEMWPYEYRVGQTAPPPVDVSQGTLAMVLTTTGRLIGHCKLPKGTFAGVAIHDSKKLKEELQKKWGAALATLLDHLATKGKVYSGSFGDNNPLTLSHLSELDDLLKPDGFATQKASLVQSLKTATDELTRRLGLDPATEPLLTPEKSRGTYYRNAFVPLRSLRAALVLNVATAPVKVSYRKFFESSLHDQLSFSSIPDSRFDPAELIYCLEGLLLCAPESVDSSLFDRVLEVLGETQNTSAYWRPNKPFLASDTGGIMLPISVEGANSLMRSTGMMDKNRLYNTFTAKALPLIKRFWHWLQARSVRFDKGGQECLGWHSEHVNDAGLVHIWDTSQVAEFMIAFREMLERHIAAESLRLSRLSLRPAKPAKGKWSDTTENFEPLLNGPVAKKVYDKLGTDFAIPWSAGDRPANYSMLLYGPPGTGKSTVAENLADFLGFPVITVTVSDFLGGGGASVEARAKAIFQTLEAQERCIILFDEIDSFLLDRDSQLYREQDSLFQFLTPGMLTKINDLRKNKRSIFIIATNYADRIDSAIKRAGRIDKQYLLPLPNAARRIKILEREFKELKSELTIEDEPELKKNTAFFGYSDLKGAVEDAHRAISTGKPTQAAASGASQAPAKASPRTQAAVEASLKGRAPATSLKSYLARLRRGEIFPAEEFMGLVALAEEAGLHDSVRKEIDEIKSSKKKLARLLKGMNDKQIAVPSNWDIDLDADENPAKSN